MKNAQITLFLIIGIVILVIMVGSIFIVNLTKENDIEDTMKKIVEVPADLEPLINYADKCVESVAKRGLFLLGKQGGMIYKNQGGLKQNEGPQLLGITYLVHEGSPVPYKIFRPTGAIGCETQLPNHPTTFYPYLNRDFTTVSYARDGCFGGVGSFDLQESLDDIRSYIENHTVEDCNFDIFKNYRAQKGIVDADVDNKANKIVINVSFPIVFENVNSNLKFDYDGFYYMIKLDLANLYDYVSKLIDSERNDPKYNIITGITGYDYAVHIEKDKYNNDDMIMVRKNDLILDGKPFTFHFARKNRYPALEYVYNTTFSTHQLSSLTQITYQDIVQQDIRAVDPDEDDVETYVELFPGTYKAFKLTTDNSYTVTSGDRTAGVIEVLVKATDSEYTDFQKERVNKAGENELFRIT